MFRLARKYVAVGVSVVLVVSSLPSVAAACEGGGEEEATLLVAVSPEIPIALKKAEENNNVVVSFENSSATKSIEIQKEPLLGGDTVSWAINAKGEQPANLCKTTLILKPNGTCSVRTTFKSGMKAKKEGAGKGYVATLTETAVKGGSATSKLNGEVTN